MIYLLELGMTKTVFETIHEAFTTLEFFQAAYAGDAEYQRRQNEVIAILVNRSERNPHSYESKLFAGVAKAIHEASQPSAAT
jgi:hypothetical protein